jgi:hypothetical protein
MMKPDRPQAFAAGSGEPHLRKGAREKYNGVFFWRVFLQRQKARVLLQRA